MLYTFQLAPFLEHLIIDIASITLSSIEKKREKKQVKAPHTFFALEGVKI